MKFERRTLESVAGGNKVFAYICMSVCVCVVTRKFTLSLVLRALKHPQEKCIKGHLSTKSLCQSNSMKREEFEHENVDKKYHFSVKYMPTSISLAAAKGNEVLLFVQHITWRSTPTTVTSTGTGTALLQHHCNIVSFFHSFTVSNVLNITITNHLPRHMPHNARIIANFHLIPL